jgi:hypothetical protein
VTVRSTEKGQAIVGSIDSRFKAAVSYVTVSDVSEEGAFDDVCHRLVVGQEEL